MYGRPHELSRYANTIPVSLGCRYTEVIAESEREGTRAETRIGLSAKRTSPFKSVGGGQFSRLLAIEECGSAGKTTGYPLHSHLSPSLPLPCVTVCRLIPIQLYHSHK